MNRLLKEPLAQFLLIGVALYIFLTWLVPPQAADRDEIAISENEIRTYLTRQHELLGNVSAEDYWKSLTAQQRADVTNQYLREEALYREALALGLDREDQVIRQRLIEKMEYLALGTSDPQEGISDEEARQYFAANSSQYLMPARATFTHVFLSNAKYTPDELELEASEMLATLRQDQVPFAASGKFGDRFHFHRNYVSRSADFVISHFGEAFATGLFSIDLESHWEGPFKSPYGLHLVMLKRIEPSWVPEYEDVAGSVLADLRAQRREEITEENVGRIRKKYRVKYVDIDEPN